MSDKALTNELWSQDETARYLGISVRSLERQRVAGGGIPFVKLGRLVKYRAVDVYAYVAASVRSSTSDAGHLAGGAR